MSTPASARGFLIPIAILIAIPTFIVLALLLISGIGSVFAALPWPVAVVLIVFGLFFGALAWQTVSGIIERSRSERRAKRYAQSASPRDSAANPHS